MNAQPSLLDWSPPRYPDAPGWKSADTSRDAALAIAPHAESLMGRVLAQLGKGEATADEVAAALGESVLSIRPRFSQLLAKKLIAATGDRRANESGMKAKVWRVMP